MAIGQTAVNNPFAAFAGMSGDASFKRDKSAVNGGAAEIPFGVAVKFSALGEDGLTFVCLPLASDNDHPVGVVMHDHSKAKDTELGDTGLKQYITFGLRTEGPVWVLLDSDAGVAPGAEVHVMGAPGMGEVAGSFRATADGIKTTDVSQYAHWESGPQDGPNGTKVALLWVDFAGAAVGATDS